MQKKSVFVTVGTTRFEKLVAAATTDGILNKLSQLGYSEMIVQTGDGPYEAKTHPVINIQYQKYYEDFIGEVYKHDLIISHAGAGTCLEVLKCGKPLIVVINEDLMGNHQLELAEQLQNDNYVYYATCSSLMNVLSKDLSCLKKYPKASDNLFSNYLNKCMGFS